MVLESVSCTEEDLLFTDAETGDDADAETIALEQLSTNLLSLHKCSMSFQKERQTQNLKKTRAHTMQQTVKCDIAKNQQRVECFHSVQIIYEHEHTEIM